MRRRESDIAAPQWYARQHVCASTNELHAVMHAAKLANLVEHVDIMQVQYEVQVAPGACESLQVGAQT